MWIKKEPLKPKTEILSLPKIDSKNTNNRTGSDDLQITDRSVIKSKTVKSKINSFNSSKDYFNVIIYFIILYLLLFTDLKIKKSNEPKIIHTKEIEYDIKSKTDSEFQVNLISIRKASKLKN